MCKTYLVTFANTSSPYYKNFSRLKKECEKYGYHIFFYTEDDLGVSYREFAQLYPKGYGYWSWKPFVIRNALKRIDQGDILVYIDSGCTVQGRAEIPKNIDILCFSLSWTRESDWTKPSVLTMLECENPNEPQILATFHAYRKCERVEQFLLAWETLCKIPDLVEDELIGDELHIKNHRHDQSIFSLLIKKDVSRVKIIPESDFTSILATRIK